MVLSTKYIVQSPLYTKLINYLEKADKLNYMSASYQDLIVWQKSGALAKEVYVVFGSCKDYGFKDQIQRAAVSVMNNIAEGYARHSNKAFKNFLFISRGSCAEVESMLFLAKDLGYINQLTYDALTERTQENLRLLTGFIKKL